MDKPRAITRRVFIHRSALKTMGTMLIPCAGFPDGHYSRDSASDPDLDWGKMLGEFDLTWKDLPANMSEAPHFGNGLLGSMIWVEQDLVRLQVFRSDIHDRADETYGWTAYSRPRYQIGYFTFKPKGLITGCNLRQGLYNAELNGVILTSEGNIRIHHIVHRTEDIIYTKLEAGGNEEIPGLIWHPFPARGSRGGDPGDKSYGQVYAPYRRIVNPEPTISLNDTIRVCNQDLEAGGDYATAWQEIRSDGKGFSHLVTIQNDYPGKDSAKKAILALQKATRSIEQNPESWIEWHRSWWHSYYPESYVSFPDHAGEAFYWNNIYKLACCTRPDAQYIDTPGIWNSGGPWPYSTHDFNTQTAHFPVYTANRLHLGAALLNALRRSKNTLVDNVVPAEWRSDSAYLNLATAFDLKAKRDEDGRYRDLFGCLPWLLNNVWLHYRYTMDREILRDPLFPLLRRSVNLYRHILFEGGDGRLHLPPTFVPESGIYSDSNFDLALLKWSCIRLLEISRILKVNDPLEDEWRHILERLTEYSINESGYMIGAGASAPEDHQHMSHLMMIYPLYLETIENQGNRDLLEKSVRNFHPKTMPKMGASQSSPAASALGLGNLALERMNEILHSTAKEEKLGKNGIYYLATPCIETSLSYNTCVQDMLLQSWGNRIRVFPALPDRWTDVQFYNFRAEGGFLISARREKGITSFVRIKSLAGEPCRISTSIEGAFELAGRSGISLKKLEDGTCRIDMQKGDEIVLNKK